LITLLGNKYWIFEANTLAPGYPKPITSIGLPADLDKIDAAMTWGPRKSIYFFSGERYWKFDEERNRIELSYPRNFSVWKGVPTNLDAAFSPSSEGKLFSARLL